LGMDAMGGTGVSSQTGRDPRRDCKSVKSLGLFLGKVNGSRYKKSKKKGKKKKGKKKKKRRKNPQEQKKTQGTTSSFSIASCSVHFEFLDSYFWGLEKRVAIVRVPKTGVKGPTNLF